MRKIIALICVCLSFGTLTAQDAFAKGDLVISGSVGIGNTLYSDNFDTKIPFLSVIAEYGILDDLIDGNASIGVGGQIGYHTSEYKWNGWGGGGKAKNTDWLFAARGAFHYEFMSNLDTYGGVRLAYHNSKTTVDSSISVSAVGDGFTFGLFGGARYYFTDNWAALAEVGFGGAILDLGIAYKF